MGKPYQATTHMTPDAIRMDIKSKEPMTMVHTNTGCWSQSGASVSTCSDKELTSSKHMMAMHKAALLWPLKHPYRNMGWQFQSLGKKALGGKEYFALQVKYPAYGVIGTLYFGVKDHLLTYMTYPGTLKDKKGEFLIEMKNHKVYCGVKMPTKSSAQFNYQPYYTEKVVDVKCEQFNEKLFAPPQGKFTSTKGRKKK
jgi:hypothetical protein